MKPLEKIGQAPVDSHAKPVAQLVSALDDINDDVSIHLVNGSPQHHAAVRNCWHRAQRRSLRQAWWG